MLCPIRHLTNVDADQAFASQKACIEFLLRCLIACHNINSTCLAVLDMVTVSVLRSRQRSHSRCYVSQCSPSTLHRKQVHLLTASPWPHSITMQCQLAATSPLHHSFGLWPTDHMLLTVCARWSLMDMTGTAVLVCPSSSADTWHEPCDHIQAAPQLTSGCRGPWALQHQALCDTRRTWKGLCAPCFSALRQHAVCRLLLARANLCHVAQSLPDASGTN